jgi:hypothetical protein
MKHRIARALLALTLAGVGAACGTDTVEPRPALAPPAVEPSTELTGPGVVETITVPEETNTGTDAG